MDKIAVMQGMLPVKTYPNAAQVIRKVLIVDPSLWTKTVSRPNGLAVACVDKSAQVRLLAKLNRALSHTGCDAILGRGLQVCVIY